MKAQVIRYKIPSVILLSAAAVIEKVLNLPGEESADVKSRNGNCDGAAQPDGEEDKLKNHLTASLCGPDERCTSEGR